MKYVCDAPGGNTWFRIETEAEAASESDAMRHAVEKFFRKEQEKATQTFQPSSKLNFEQEIGLKAHIQREMPLFLTLRDDEGNPLVTAMLPPGGHDDRSFRPIIVGMANADPYNGRQRSSSPARGGRFRRRRSGSTATRRSSCAYVPRSTRPTLTDRSAFSPSLRGSACSACAATRS